MFSKFVAGLLDRIHGRSERLRAQKHMEGRPLFTPQEYASHYFPFDKADIAAQVRTIFSKHISLDISQVHPNDKLVEDPRVVCVLTTIRDGVTLVRHAG